VKYRVNDEKGYLNTVFDVELFDEVLDVVKGKVHNSIFKKYSI